MSGAAGPANLAAVISDNTKLIMIESPTNPMQRIINIPDICRVAHSKNALVEVSSFFFFFQPFVADTFVRLKIENIGVPVEYVLAAVFMTVFFEADNLTNMGETGGGIILSNLDIPQVC